VLGDLYSYLWLLAGYAKWLLAGGPFFIDSLIKRAKPDWAQKIDALVLPKTRQKIEIGAILLAMFIAGFLTWRDEHTAKLLAENTQIEENKALRARISNPENQQRDDTKLYQGGKIVASVSGLVVHSGDDSLGFAAVTADRELDFNKDFEYGPWKLNCVGEEGGSMNYGAFRQISYQRVHCKISGTR
jgi:hypothetical protein